VVVDTIKDVQVPLLSAMNKLQALPLADRTSLILAPHLESAVEGSLRILVASMVDARVDQKLLVGMLKLSELMGIEAENVPSSEIILMQPKVTRSAKRSESESAVEGPSEAAKTVLPEEAMSVLLERVKGFRAAVVRPGELSSSPDVLMRWGETLVGFACKAGRVVQEADVRAEVAKFTEIVRGNPKDSPISQFKLVVVAPRADVRALSLSLPSSESVTTVVLSNEATTGADGERVPSQCEQLLGSMIFSEMRRSTARE
jgi:hypothetical protein